MQLTTAWNEKMYILNIRKITIITICTSQKLSLMSSLFLYLVLIMIFNEISKPVVPLTSTNLLYRRKRKQPSLLLCTALGHSPVSKRRDHNHFCTCICTIHEMTTNVHNYTPWFMLNFPTSRKMCLVSTLGWIWAMQCLDRLRWGNLLWKHAQPYLSLHSLN